MTAILLLTGLHQNAFGDIKSEVENIISEKDGNDGNITLVKYTIPGQKKKAIENQTQQKFYGDYVYLWLNCGSDSLLSFAILDNVYGKSMPITFLTIFDHEGTITYTEIIRYREPFGGAVASRNWLDQFNGKLADDEFNIGKNIDTITGATISVGAVTRGIKKLTLLSQYLLKNNVISCPQNEPITETSAK